MSRNHVTTALRALYPEANVKITWIRRKGDKVYNNELNWDVTKGPLPREMADAVAQIAPNGYRFRLFASGYDSDWNGVDMYPLVKDKDQHHHSPVLVVVNEDYCLDRSEVEIIRVILDACDRREVIIKNYEGIVDNYEKICSDADKREARLQRECYALKNMIYA